MAMRRKHHNSVIKEKCPIERTGFYPYLQHYLEARAVKGYSDKTLTAYDCQLRGFIKWCEERALDQPQDITKPILERYQKHLYYYRKPNGKPLSFSSQKRQIVTVKGFFKWLTQQNHLLYNPASELESPRTGKALPRVILSREEIGTLLSLPDITTPGGLRDRTIMELFYSTGLRRTELANLAYYDLDFSRHALIVKSGKGNKDRYLPISPRMQSWLEKYLDEGREAFASALDEDRLFITDFGEPFNGSYLGGLIKGYFRRAGIDKPGACHLFRHAMATHMLENGADIRFIQSMLGHSDLSSTQIYTRVSVEKLRAVHAATHPAEARKGEGNNKDC